MTGVGASGGYAELQVTTNFSFLRGASHPHELFGQAKDLGIAALGVTDRNSVAGIVQAWEAARETGVRLVAGCRLDLRPEAPGAPGPALLAFPTDRPAWSRLCGLLTLGRKRVGRGPGNKGGCDLGWDDVAVANAGLLLVLVPTDDAALPRQLARLHADAPGRAYLAGTVRRRPGDAARLHHLAELGRAARAPLIATGDVLYHVPQRRILQDVVTCIREGVTIDDAGFRRERHADRHLKAPGEMARLFARHPDALERTLELTDRCGFDLAHLRYQYPNEVQDPALTPQQTLERMTWEGASRCYPVGTPDKVVKQLKHELGLIAQLEYAPYFLTVHSIVCYARSKEILCQGRGSAANSAVCYVLGITSLDPAESNLLFERFMSAARKEPPDIDVDFEHDRREEIIQWVYDHYGRDRAALCATVMRFRARGAIRDVGKALGLTEDVTGALAGQVWGWSEEGVTEDHAEALNLNLDDRRLRLTLDLARDLIGFPRQLGTHPGGFVLTQAPLSELVPVLPAAMADRQIIEWDKDDIDALRFMKMDVLGVGMLGCMRRAFDLLEEHKPACSLSLRERAGVRGSWLRSGKPQTLTEPGPSPASAALDCRGARAPRNDEVPEEPPSPPKLAPMTPTLSRRRREPIAPLDLSLIPLDDAPTFDMICRADTLGTFQIESRAQMSMLPRMQPRRLYDLVIQVAIVRPGPIQGGMVHPYLRRRAGLEQPSYPSPELKEVLKETLGVPLFQEQAMQVAIHCAGFTPDEADQLRRSMATFKQTGGVESFRDQFIEGMQKNKYSTEFAEQMFNQIKGFGSYGFPESHAASFALVAYASAWMKCHHPDVFCAALLNSQPMGFYAPAQVVRDAREHGVPVRPVDVNHSRWDSTLEPTDGPLLAVRLGLRMVGGLQGEHAAGLVAARGEHPYTDLDDLWRRAGVPIAALEHLAEADALGSLGLNRREALWAIRGLADTPLPLFAAADNRPEIVEPPVTLDSMRPGREVVEDYGSTGLSLRAHPLAFLRAELRRRGMVACADLAHLRDGRRVVVPGLVLVRQKPGSAKGVMFITTEDETGVANLILWPSVFARQRRLVLSATMIACHGKVQKEAGVIHVIADRLEDLSSLLRSVGERDDPWPLRHGRGDGATHPGSPDRGDLAPRARDVYVPETPRGIRVPTRDFR